MKDKTCKDCIFHKERPGSKQTCEYPVPAWIKIALSNWHLSEAGYEAESCSVYRTRESIAETLIEKTR